MRRGLRLFLSGLSGLVVLSASAAHACPMCSQSIAEENLLPHAYMYSILFMLAMPAVVFVGVGSIIYFKFRKFYAAQPVPVVEPAAIAASHRADRSVRV